MSLTSQQLERYRRNIDVIGMGVEGQERLLASSALVIGAGGLGSSALPYLAAAGVGRIGVVDGDTVELVNMQRQVLHTEMGRNKAVSATERLRLINPDVEVEAHPEFVDVERAAELMEGYDVVLDCCDSFASKFIVSDAAARTSSVLVWATAVGMQGQATVFGIPDARGHRRYLRDLHPEEPATGEYPQATDIGVLGTTPGIMGAVEANEAIKFLAGFGEVLHGRIQLLDGLQMRWHTIEWKG